MIRPVTTVLTYGTFDLFHHGHVRLLQRLSQLGDELIVGCSTDAFNAVKGKRCVMPYGQRREILEACRYVARVIPEDSWAQKRSDIVNYNVSIFAMGDDWAGHFDDLGDLTRVIYLPRTQDVSTTELKERIQQRVSAA
ncbi:adenylyltransferase/cytidyltransferase family protein [Pseudosulfitobacter pseudonitzschiae]|uniref:adenylyltransferase/cytidyltransferase family protein n=1 Tax=Pseudosulfitobacter pseudonitzschiae TaxID=1402135 RepID=UPI00068AB6FC|nr:adenylyltransferase/cytidyltransferase family protein [Pseudosulfitobacter pseudonitzschiae]SHF81744.1 Glycerol-3-phosphate cytidylyltransferase [Pseudosulfitobacter pseudonitzschiae]